MIHPEQPKRYVQDLMWDQRVSVARLVSSPATHIYVCGLKGMEDGVLRTPQKTAEQCGLNWESLWSLLKSEGRLHLETY
jgi:benzoyl-CoA 2,3-epoxidase subunit A